MQKHIKTKIFITIFSISILILLIPSISSASSKMKVEWFNVGAGDSMFIKLANNKTVLIDGGTIHRGYSIVNKLQKMHVQTINYCISSHPDSDHAGGLQIAFQQLKVKNFYYPNDTIYNTVTARKVIRLAKSENGCKLHHPNRGYKIKSGGATITFVQSNRNYTTDNQDSLAEYLNYGKLQILVAGDNEKGSENAIQKHNVDILQLPHHGSKYSTSMYFIKKFDPENVVISTDGHKYGHPNKEVFKRLKAYSKKIKVWRTDKKGDIIVIATKNSWKFTKSGVVISKYCRGSSGNTSGSSGTASRKVFITRTGTKYHKTKSCRGLNAARKIYAVSKSTAKSKGLTPCKLCW